MAFSPSHSDDYKTFAVSYRHEGAEWALQLKARDIEDAKARLARLSFGTVDGELVTSVPAPFGLIAKMMVALRNALA